MEIKVATRTGPSHIIRGIPNQDAFAYDFIGDYSLAAVADGAGSKENAKLGAEYSASWTIDYLHNNLQQGFPITESLESAVKMTAEELRLLENYKSYGATLAACVKGPEETFIKTVGDAFAVVDTGEELVLVRAEQFNPAPNITTFLTSDKWETTTYLGPANTVFLCSDGMEFGSLIGGVELFKGFWSPLAKTIETADLDELLDLMDSYGKLNDDTTILAV